MIKKIFFFILAMLLLTLFLRRTATTHVVPAQHTPTRAQQSHSRNMISTSVLKQGAGRAEYSPDGASILFHMKGDDGRYDVYVMDTTGENERCITCSSELFSDRHAGNASWHPDGRYVAFQAEKASYWKHPGANALTHPGIGWHNDIWVATVDGSSFTQITSVSAKKSLFDRTPFSAVLHPHFSPDGTTISWGETTNNTLRGWSNWKLMIGDFTIEGNTPFVRNIAAYTPQNANNEYYESDDFDAAGDTLLISANLEPDQDPLGMDIYSFHVPTNQLTRLTDGVNDWDEAAIYSPDNSQIVWLSSTGYEFDAQDKRVWWLEGKADFWIMNADGSEKRQITFFNTPGTEDYTLVEGNRVIPAYIEWHPDGNTLLASISVEEDGSLVDMIVRITLLTN